MKDTTVERLPKTSGTHQLLDMLNDLNWSAPQIAAVIIRDRQLTAEVFRLANSANYNPVGTRIEKLEHAIMRIGHRQLEEMVISKELASIQIPAVIARGYDPGVLISAVSL